MSGSLARKFGNWFLSWDFEIARGSQGDFSFLMNKTSYGVPPTPIYLLKPSRLLGPSEQEVPILNPIFQFWGSMTFSWGAALAPPTPPKIQVD